MSAEHKVYSLEEVSTHNKDGDAWIVIDGKVYNVSQFNQHPGGPQAITRSAGKDVSKTWHAISEKHDLYAGKYLLNFLIGTLAQ